MTAVHIHIHTRVCCACVGDCSSAGRAVCGRVATHAALPALHHHHQRAPEGHSGSARRLATASGACDAECVRCGVRDGWACWERGCSMPNEFRPAPATRGGACCLPCGVGEGGHWEGSRVCPGRPAACREEVQGGRGNRMPGTFEARNIRCHFADAATSHKAAILPLLLSPPRPLCCPPCGGRPPGCCWRTCRALRAVTAAVCWRRRWRAAAMGCRSSWCRRTSWGCPTPGGGQGRPGGARHRGRESVCAPTGLLRQSRSLTARCYGL